MTDLDCYVEAIATGTLLGIDRHWGPAQVDALLGGEGPDGLNISTHHWWRDYGLAEIFWGRASIAEHWTGHHFSLQLHRLPGDWCRPNEMLTARHGEFRQRTRFTDLQAALAQRDIPLVQRPYVDDDYLQFEQPASGTTLLVLNHHPAPDPDYPDLGFGDVYSISSSAHPRHLPLGNAPRETSTHQPPTAPTLPPSSPPTLSSSSTSSPTSTSSPSLSSTPSSAPAPRPTEPSPPSPPLELPSPTPDEFVRQALAAVPLTPAQTRWADPTVRGPQLPDQLLTREIIATAARYRRRVTNPAIAADLAEWLTLWPELR